MAQVKAIVVTGFGTNCDRETAHAARVSGADQVDIVYFSDLISEKITLDDYNFLLFPGGFLDGDDLGAAQAAAQRWRYARTKSGQPVIDQLKNLFDRGGIILGICNGFQLLVKLGLLPACEDAYFERQASLAHNDSSRFEDRWVHLKANADSPCVFLRGIREMYLPVRHGEGKLVFKDEATLGKIITSNLNAITYIDPESGAPTLDYPFNPNGSPKGIAGLTDPTGRVFGLMPHPEAYNHPTNHPGWTRGEKDVLGLAVIENGITYLRAQ